MATLREIERFLREEGLPHTTFGKLVANDPSLMTEFRCGQIITDLMSHRIDGFIAAMRTGVAWQRPEPMREMKQKVAPVPTGHPLESFHQEAEFRRFMSRGSRDLLAALWRSHPGIMAIRGAVRT